MDTMGANNNVGAPVTRTRLNAAFTERLEPVMGNRRICHLAVRPLGRPDA